MNSTGMPFETYCSYTPQRYHLFFSMTSYAYVQYRYAMHFYEGWKVFKKLQVYGYIVRYKIETTEGWRIRRNEIPSMRWRNMADWLVYGHRIGLNVTSPVSWTDKYN